MNLEPELKMKTLSVELILVIQGRDNSLVMMVCANNADHIRLSIQPEINALTQHVDQMKLLLKKVCAKRAQNIKEKLILVSDLELKQIDTNA